MADVIVVIFLIIIIGAAITYIVKAKKSGAKCIGCPAGGKCSGRKERQSGCCCHNDTDG